MLIRLHSINDESIINTRHDTLRKRMLDSVVAVVFLIIFCVEMHANDVFLFFKNHF
jgi:lipopolysaccharide/colanic/teichoic acid biosynthesis glycosyltransferase